MGKRLLSVLLFLVLSQTGKAQHQGQALTARDSVLLMLIDSLETERREQLQAERQYQLARGYWPAGLLNLELGRLFNYNHHEGIKPGLGLETSSYLSTRFTLAGFYSYSLRTGDHSYGGSFVRHLPGGIVSSWQIYAHRDQYETGSFSFLGGPIGDERLRKYAIGTVDRSEAAGVTFTLRQGKMGQGALHYSFRHLTPLLSYPFSFIQDQAPPAFAEHLYGFSWRYNFSRWENSHVIPILYANLQHGRGTEQPGSNYWQAEWQADLRYEPTGRHKSSLRIQASQIWDAPRLTHLYSAFGTRSNPVGLESRHSMATMRPNEFAATQFIQAFLRHSIVLHNHGSQFFQPVLTLSTSILWGTLDPTWAKLAKTLEKGYFESGIYFEDLLRVEAIGYGLAVHYRYGPYQLTRPIDNWSIRLGLNFHL